MKRQLIYILVAASLVSSCKLYSNYERPKNLPLASYRDTTATDGTLAADTINFGNMPWREVFTDAQLQKLIVQALDTNFNMKSAEINIKKAEAALKVARLAYYPGLSFSPSGTISSYDWGKATKTYSLPIQASWQFGSIGSIRNTKKMAEISLLQAKVSKQAIRTQMIASVANMYYTLLMLDEQLKTTKETSIIWEKNVAALETMQKAGMTTMAAVAQSKANYYSIKASIPTLEENIRQTENQLCFLLREPSHHIERTTLEAQTFPASLSAGVPMQMLANRPDVRLYELNMASAFYATNKARSSFYPSITLSGSAGWTNSAGGMIVNPAKFIASAVASLVQPLFQHGTLMAQLKIAKLEQEQAQLDFEQSLFTAGQEVSNALSSYQTAIQQANARKIQVEALQTACDQTSTLFSYGNTTTYLETLTAQQSLLNAQLNLISDQFDKMQAVVNLFQALGGGRENP